MCSPVVLTLQISFAHVEEHFKYLTKALLYSHCKTYKGFTQQLLASLHLFATCILFLIEAHQHYIITLQMKFDWIYEMWGVFYFQRNFVSSYKKRSRYLWLGQPAPSLSCICLCFNTLHSVNHSVPECNCIFFFLPFKVSKEECFSNKTNIGVRLVPILPAQKDKWTSTTIFS